MNTKKSLLIAAIVVGVSFAGVSGASLVSAATTTTGGTSLAQSIADAFKLNKDDVQNVIDQNRSDNQAKREAKEQNRLTQAVTDKKITQAQADYITKAQADITAVIAATTPKDLTASQKADIKTKTTALRTWAKANNVPVNLIRGDIMRGGMKKMREDKTSTDSAAVETN